jgi:hypothetical protein
MVPNLNLIFGLFVVAACLVFAYFAAFSDYFAVNYKLDGNKRLIFVGLLVGYSIYRSYRIYKSYKEQRDEDEIDS